MINGKIIMNSAVENPAALFLFHKSLTCNVVYIREHLSDVLLKCKGDFIYAVQSLYYIRGRKDFTCFTRNGEADGVSRGS